MPNERVSRRRFMRQTSLAAAAAGAAGTAAALSTPRIVRAGNPENVDTAKILNYNSDMEYRRCGKTNLMISAVSLGGHWKRVVKMIGGQEPAGWMTMAIDRADFQKNRAEVVSRCIDRGINYVDACCGEEILAYAKAIQGRRDKMYFGYSWHVKESRFPEWRSAARLKQGLDEGMKEAGLAHVDLWRISLLTDSVNHQDSELDEVAAALDWAKQTGRARFIGISSHDRTHIKRMLLKFPKQLEVILTPYTAKTRVVDDESGLWAAIRKADVGWFGIKPFASNTVFKGDSSPDSPHAHADNEIARLTLRAILCNTAITAPIPGLISELQVDNAAMAVKERRELDLEEKARLDAATERAWANLPPRYRWLDDWQVV
jgi:aryl-alcohol dehydrogenase-like predicted oxidoreductase